MSGGIVETVIGPVTASVTGSVVSPPPISPPGTGGGGIGKPGGSGGLRSPFEIAVKELNPAVFYRFRDTDFSANIQDNTPGGQNNLVKQVAAATRSSVPTRTTHPGGAYFPAVTFDNWATQGTEYKAAANSVLSGLTEYTAIISFRMIAAPSSAISKVFAVGTEDVGETGSNDLVVFRSHFNAPTSPHYWKHRTTSGGLIPVDFAVTEKLEDGVNRLATVRYKFNEIFRLATSKPGYEYQVEESVDASSGSGLATLSRAILVNARTETGTGSATTLGMVIDSIALVASDIGATAEADLHSKWMTEVAGAGYYPSMMQFDGSTGYYNATYTSSGNLVTACFRIKVGTFTGGGQQTILRINGPTGDIRILLRVGASDNADSDYQDRLQFLVQNSSATAICRLYSNVDAADGQEHIVFAAFDGDNGTATFYIDGVAADNGSASNRVAPTTGTLDSGASTTVAVGANYNGTEPTDASVGFVGYRDAYLTNYTDFINSTDNSLPAPIDEKNWSQWDGRSAGDPGMTEFDGSTGYYSRSYTSTGDVVTVVCRFCIDSFSGGGVQGVVAALGPSGYRRVLVQAISNDAATASERDKIQVQVRNSSNAIIARLYSTDTVIDGGEHVLFFAFNGNTGEATFYIDGVDADDTGHVNRVTPTTGTLDSGASSTFLVGATSGTPANLLDGKVGFIGHREVALSNPTDFSTGSTPADIDEVDWTEWGAQPLFWNRTGEMTDNKGSAGNMTANGLIKPPRPLFWSHTGQMTNNKGSAGDMTANGTITMTEGGSP